MSAPPTFTSSDTLVIETLTEAHDVRKFRSTEDEIAVYLRSLAKPSTTLGFGRTYVAVEPGQRRVWGYYTISNTALDISQFPSPIDKAPASLPAVRIGRMGRDMTIPFSGVGEFLLMYAFETAYKVSRLTAVYCLVLNAKNEALKSRFYAKYGFLPLADDPLHLFIPVSVIQSVLREIDII